MLLTLGSYVLHMDLASPMEMTSFDGKKYFLIIVDDKAQLLWVESLTFKSEVMAKIQNFIFQFETAYGVKVCSIMGMGQNSSIQKCNAIYM